MTQRLGGHREQFVLCFKSRGQQVKGCWGWCMLMGPVGGPGAGLVLQVCRGWARPGAAFQAPQRAEEGRGPAGRRIPLSLSRNFLFLPGPQLREPREPIKPGALQVITGCRGPGREAGCAGAGGVLLADRSHHASRAAKEGGCTPGAP